jgi:hypothetical protein
MVRRLALALVAVWATSTTNLIKDLGLGFLPQVLKMKSDRFCKGAIASSFAYARKRLIPLLSLSLT